VEASLMVDRLSSLDVSFLYMEQSTTAMHVGGVAIFSSPEDRPFDYEGLVRLIEERIGLVPRFRQKVKWVPGKLANPVWVDDPDFDVSFHVRRSALPRPGTEDQLRDLVGRLMSRQLDRSRPLWEMYLVEGLADGRTAVVTKTHHAMVDGIAAMDIGSVILDLSPTPRETSLEDWTPAPEPSGVSLIAGALTDLATKPTEVLSTLRSSLADVKVLGGRTMAMMGGLLSAAKVVGTSAPMSPLNVPIREQRRFGMARTELDDYKRIRKAHGGTVNDVVLAVVAGALRTWMLTRGEPVTPATTLRAMVPVSVRPSQQRGETGNKVASYFCDLPIGEPNAIMRLHQISYSMREVKESQQSVGAEAIVAMAGFAPPTLHSLGARAGSSLSRRLFNLVVTNVPGPQIPLYAAGARMLEIYPVVPLAKNQAVCVGVTSYDGGVYYGLNADRDAMPDLDVLAQCLEESLAELVGTTR
jgi:diacylglycerol O-acyltransferase